MITEKKKIKKTFGFILIMFGLIYFSSILTNNLSAQSLDQSANWKLYSEINGIQIYSKQIECNDETNGLFQEVVILKFVNTTNNNFTIDWDYELWYDNKCWTCGNENLDEDHKTITLKSQEILEGDCEYNNNTLRIFKRYTNHTDTAVLTKFELKNMITVIN